MTEGLKTLIAFKTENSVEKIAADCVGLPALDFVLQNRRVKKKMNKKQESPNYTYIKSWFGIA